MGPALPPASAAKAAMAVEGLCRRRRFTLKVLKLRFMERAVRESLARACFAGLRRWDVRRTVMMGATLAMVSMPKPSVLFTCKKEPPFINFYSRSTTHRP